MTDAGTLQPRGVQPDGLLVTVVGLSCKPGEEHPLVSRLERKAFHVLLDTVLEGSFNDISNGVIAVRREVLEQNDLYGDYHQFFCPRSPCAMAFRWRSFRSPHMGRIEHFAYTLCLVYFRCLIDLSGLIFLVRFTYQLLRFFEMLAVDLIGVGAAILTAPLVQRLGGRWFTCRPVLMLVMGVHHNISLPPMCRLREGRLPSDNDVERADQDEHSVKVR